MYYCTGVWSLVLCRENIPCGLCTDLCKQIDKYKKIPEVQIDIAAVEDCFSFNPLTGEFTWNKPVFGRVFSSCPVKR